MTISEKIKSLCAAKGTSLYALEKQIGLGNGTIGKWGKNGRVPNYAKLSAVCDALGVSIADVMAEDDQPEPQGQAEGIKKAPAPEGVGESKMKLLAALDGLTDEQCDKMLEIVLAAKKMF